MIPILYSDSERHFSTGGIGFLGDCISCIVTEERNGIYECELQYPVTGKWYQEMHDNGGFIGCWHDDNHDVQPFEIYSFSAPIDGVVTFYAHHISYRLNTVLLHPFAAGSVAEVMVKIPQNSVNNNVFEFWTDKQTAANFRLSYPQSVRATLGGTAGSILDVYGGGEYEFDKYTVKLYDHRGEDKPVTIRYGKNMSDFLHERDTSECYNAVAPYWRDTEGNVVYLDEIYVVSPAAVGNLMAPWTNDNDVIMTNDQNVEIDFNYVLNVPMAKDFTEYFDEAPTQDQLRQKALQYLAQNQPWIPDDTITVDFVQMWQSPEYADVSALQRLALCDTVSVYYPELGVVAEQQKIVKVVYNVLLERYDEMELGKPQTSLFQRIEGEVLAETDRKLSDFGSVMQSAIDKATDLITGGLGGHVVFNLNAEGQPQEILIMDTDDINTAVNVIRMNKNGIGFSTTGYDGEYRSAWTIDGAFVADFITAGTLNANVIKAGILSDYAGLNSWNMLTGDLTLSGRLQGVYSDVTMRMGDFLFPYFATINNQPTLQERWEKSWQLFSTVSNSYAQYKVAVVANFSGGYSGIFKLEENYHDSTNIWGGMQYDREHETYVIHTHENTTPGSGNTDKILYLFKKRRDGERMQVLDADGNLLMCVSVSASGIIYGVNSGASTATDLVNGNVLKYDASSETWYFQAAHMYVRPDGLRFAASNSGAAYVKQTNINNERIQVGVTGGYRTLIENDKITVEPTNSASVRVVILPNNITVNGKSVQVQSSSSLRYKHDIASIKDKVLDPHRLLGLPVRQFRYNADAKLQYEDMEGQLLPGLIAEEVEDIYPSAVIHKDGKVESWDERRIIPGMLALIQEQAKKIDELEARLEKLERLVMKDAD